MTEQELRALVREAVERHLGRPSEIERRCPEKVPEKVPGTFSSLHPSHILLKVVPGSDMDDGSCVIEPSVRCNHCGFCQSYGH